MLMRIILKRFECYPGYELIGPKSLNCVHGEWNRGTPYCVRDIARGKPVVQSEPLTIDFSTELLVDGNDSTCTQPASRWSVDLFEKSRITVSFDQVSKLHDQASYSEIVMDVGFLCRL